MRKPAEFRQPAFNTVSPDIRLCCRAVLQSQEHALPIRFNTFVLQAQHSRHVLQRHVKLNGLLAEFFQVLQSGNTVLVRKLTRSLPAAAERLFVLFVLPAQFLEYRSVFGPEASQYRSFIREIELFVPFPVYFLFDQQSLV